MSLILLVAGVLAGSGFGRVWLYRGVQKVVFRSHKAAHRIILGCAVGFDFAVSFFISACIWGWYPPSKIIECALLAVTATTFVAYVRTPPTPKTKCASN